MSQQSARDRYEQLEQQYEAIRETATPAQLERLAVQVTAAAQALAIQRGWVLPEPKIGQQYRLTD